MTQQTSNVRLKLLIDSETRSVLYGEADKDFIDFLFSLLSLPLGAVIRLLQKQHMVGCLGNLYDSIETLNETCFIQPSQTKEVLLRPKGSLNCSTNLMPYITNQTSSSSVSVAPSSTSSSSCSSFGEPSNTSSYSFTFGAPSSTSSSSCSSFGEPSNTSSYSFTFGEPSSTSSYSCSLFGEPSSTSSYSCSLFGEPSSTSSYSCSSFGAPSRTSSFGFNAPSSLFHFSPPLRTSGFRLGRRRTRDITLFGAASSIPSGSGSTRCKASSSSSGGDDVLKVGFVKGLATYIVMDDLTVNHISDFSIVSILRKFNIKDADALEEKVITLNVDEGVELLKASLQSKMVLTDVFLRRERQIIDTYNVDEDYNLN